MKFDSRLIQRKDKVPKSERVFWGAVTALFWLAYLYLWLPLITLLMWILGFKGAFDELETSKGTIDPYVLVSLPLIALTSMITLVAWSTYNRLRFKGRDRRGERPVVGLDMIASTLGVDDHIAAEIRSTKFMTLVMNDEARPTAVRHHAIGSDDAVIAAQPPEKEQAKEPEKTAANNEENEAERIAEVEPAV
jgi:biofilm PGA synthesis protein PgaD